MTSRGPASHQPAAGGDGPDGGAWEHLTRVQGDAVRATAAATIRNPDQLAEELVALLYIPPESETDPGEPS
jgi:hypothetical protein